MSTQPAHPHGHVRPVHIGGSLALALLLAACSGAAPAPSSSTATTPGAGKPLAVAQDVQAGTTGTRVGTAGLAAAAPDGTVASVPAVGSGSGVAASSIAYPYVGPSGIAPDHSIVVTGTGTANVAEDGSNRSASERSAITAALADARAQADAVAAAAHVAITGVLSVSASVSPYYAYPAGMMVPSSGATGPTAAPPTIVSPPQGPTQLTASATVAYTIR